MWSRGGNLWREPQSKSKWWVQYYHYYYCHYYYDDNRRCRRVWLRHLDLFLWSRFDWSWFICLKQAAVKQPVYDTKQTVKNQQTNINKWQFKKGLSQANASIIVKDIHHKKNITTNIKYLIQKTEIHKRKLKTLPNKVKCNNSNEVFYSLSKSVCL